MVTDTINQQTASTRKTKAMKIYKITLNCRIYDVKIEDLGKVAKKLNGSIVEVDGESLSIRGKTAPTSNAVVNAFARLRTH